MYTFLKQNLTNHDVNSNQCVQIKFNNLNFSFTKVNTKHHELTKIDYIEYKIKVLYNSRQKKIEPITDKTKKLLKIY